MDQPLIVKDDDDYQPRGGSVCNSVVSTFDPKDEVASMHATEEDIADYFWREGDRMRQFYNALLAVLFAIGTTFLVLFINSDWLEFYQSVETMGEEDGEVVTVHRTITEGYGGTLSLIIDSGIHLVIRIWLKMVSTGMPWIKFCASCLCLICAPAGPMKLRQNFRKVAIIRSSAMVATSGDDDPTSGEDDDGVSKGFFGRLRRIVDFFFGLYFPTMEWILLGTKFKITGGYIYFLAFLQLCIPTEMDIDKDPSADYTAPDTGTSIDEIDTQVDMKSGFLYFWLSNFCFVTLASVVKIQCLRWMRRERALQLYVGARRSSMASMAGDGYYGGFETALETDLSNCSAVDKAAASGADVEAEADTMATTTNLSGADESGENDPEEEGKKEDSRQNRATFFLSVAFISHFLLLFFPIVKFNYTTVDGLKDIDSKEYTMYEFMLEIVNVSHHSGVPRFLQFIFWMEVSILPVVALMVCASLKVVRYYDRNSKWIGPLYYTLINVEHYTNPESFAVATFMVRWSVEKVSEHVLNKYDTCQALGFDDGCLKVTAEYVSGSYIAFIYGFSYLYAFALCQYDLATKLQDLMTTEAYEKILPDMLGSNHPVDMEQYRLDECNNANDQTRPLD
uniref:Uncharacterized protein n=1 Tax=Leptocylindrus danicus TaxID=163516 RepID=A0A7S2NVR3_9STRA|mmetsp:Transcript_14961/g.22091  ORF Transcript_14961/g.22091 Transcript_14961/m.22091 type:complete len:622 (+) Transcript_14961:73-1938(+)|eukprot:CAMPEP_0116013754 /NCGR_PEP_ID=MMETSP0321-20121206/5903_1 /TAXON_ID=163516 /ORGANISM="Leptocylindrus danicus var. danicus, Strain B650" /LENGTH=621 /DNA_ID=CAMNT_0003483341 /DNA_START=8 /DNA_END=1873 /DNA_ORIENTATION=-